MLLTTILPSSKVSKVNVSGYFVMSLSSSKHYFIKHFFGTVYVNKKCTRWLCSCDLTVILFSLMFRPNEFDNKNKNSLGVLEYFIGGSKFCKSCATEFIFRTRVYIIKWLFREFALSISLEIFIRHLFVCH